MKSVHKQWSVGCLVASVLVGCSAVAEEIPTAAARTVGDVFITSNIQGTGAGSNAGGLVRLVDLPATEDMQVQVEATGLPSGSHSWHIHSGTCAQPGGVVVAFTTIGQNEGLDEPIVADAQGRAAEDARVPANRLTRQQITSGSYIVNIHARSGPNPGPTIACADLR